MKTHLRELSPADMPAVEELCREQNERDGTSYGVPTLFDAYGQRLQRIPLALAAVTNGGEIRQAHAWEVTLEQMTFGIDREATVCSMHEQQYFTYLLRERGYRDMHTFVPSRRVKQMKHGLEKIFGMTDTGLRHFYRLLDNEENEALQKFHKRHELEHATAPEGTV